MRPIGFSTGAVAKGDFRAGIEAQRSPGVTAIELSALRDRELRPLLEALPELDLSGFTHVSFHAPSALSIFMEQELVSILANLPAAWPIIVHPDVISDPKNWRFLGERLCLENMDQRKPLGRTVAEMKRVFEQLPDASFCFDIGHARQVDPTMGVALGLLQQFRDRLRQVHMSEVDPQGKHAPMSFITLCAFQRVAKHIPEEIPVILESVVRPEDVLNELEAALSALNPRRSELEEELQGRAHRVAL